MARRLANGRDASLGADATLGGGARARRALGRAAAGGAGERRDAAARGGRAPAARRAALQTQTQTPNRRDAAPHHRRHGARARRYPPTAASPPSLSRSRLRRPRACEAPGNVRRTRERVKCACARARACACARLQRLARRTPREVISTRRRDRGCLPPHPAKPRAPLISNPRPPARHVCLRLVSHKFPDKKYPTKFARIIIPQISWSLGGVTARSQGLKTLLFCAILARRVRRRSAPVGRS